MGILDMLPEEPIPLMKTRGMKTLQEKKFCLLEYTCSRCGARFVLPWGAKGYVRSLHGKDLRFCSWKCLREDEKEREMPKRGRKCAPPEEHIEQMRRKNEEDAAMIERAKELGLTKKQMEAIKGRMGARKRKMGELKCTDEGNNR